MKKDGNTDKKRFTHPKWIVEIRNWSHAKNTTMTTLTKMDMK